MIVIEKRKPLTRREVIQLMLDQDGRCGCGCGVKLNPMTEGVIDEHVRALGLLGTNDLENRSLWRKPCSAAKTGKGGDQTIIAKAKAQGGETGQRARREKRGGSSIRGRGFDKRLTKGFDGKVRARAPVASESSRDEHKTARHEPNKEGQ